MNLHRQQTNHEEHRFLKVNKHLYECGNGRFLIFPLFKIRNSSDAFRDMKELQLINILQPDLNSS